MAEIHSILSGLLWSISRYSYCNLVSWKTYVDVKVQTIYKWVKTSAVWSYMMADKLRWHIGEGAWRKGKRQLDPDKGSGGGTDKKLGVDKRKHTTQTTKRTRYRWIQEVQDLQDDTVTDLISDGRSVIVVFLLFVCAEMLPWRLFQKQQLCHPARCKYCMSSWVKHEAAIGAWADPSILLFR